MDLSKWRPTVSSVVTERCDHERKVRDMEHSWFSTWRRRSQIKDFQKSIEAGRDEKIDFALLASKVSTLILAHPSQTSGQQNGRKSLPVTHWIKD
jgi:hypothetical protein